jgi:hypothetical protein
MNYVRNYFLKSLLVGALLGLAGPALADNPRLEVDTETGQLNGSEIEQGPIRAIASYTAFDYQADEAGDNFQYQLFYNGEPQLAVTDTAAMYAAIELMDLDNDGTAEVVVQTFTGGAHCCQLYTTYSWQGEQFVPVYFGYLDGGGGEFKDLDNDGRMEFVTLDNAFFYAFSSYAASYPPQVVLTYGDGQYRDATAQFQDYLAETSEDMRQAIEDSEYRRAGAVNGVLAGYVAQEIRRGHYREAWQYMLSQYNRNDDWGLEIYDDQGEVVGRHPDFPTALYAFLQELGYLDASGRPQAEVDRSPVVAERERF